LVLHVFLEEVRKVCPEGPLDRFRRHWLFWQLLRPQVVGCDAFHLLRMVLNKASDEYLGVTGLGEADRVSHEISKIVPGRLYFVLDEAQRPAGLYIDHSKPRPILCEILSAWGKTGHIIVAGTELSQKEAQEVVSSPVVKTNIPWRIRTQTGAFESFEAQSAYISRYLPPHFLVDTPSGQSLLRRCWSWLQGR
jgi:hypothetical protein